MFQNNPLLEKLKKKLNKKIPRIEGIVKSSKKGFGFLEIDSKKSYFIPPYHMKKVMHGDRIIATLQIENNREIVKPEKLLESSLNIFIGKIKKIDNVFYLIPDHPSCNECILCDAHLSHINNFNTDDWVVAKLIKHKLRGEKQFYAKIIKFIIHNIDPFAPWYVTLSRYNLDSNAPDIEYKDIFLDQSFNRKNLTKLDFITIDNFSTKDIDDALFIEKIEKNMSLIIAIADPTSYILQNSILDELALKRSFTNYLPGFNVPMLPRVLSENICSLRPNKKRAVLACRVMIDEFGNILDDSIMFFTAWIISKEKLIYENVSEWLNKKGFWKPKCQSIANQISLLYDFCIIRSNFRKKHAVHFKTKSEYKFNISDDGKILDVSVISRGIAHKIIEEAMITANICAAKVLEKKLGFGIYNIHTGFDNSHAEHVKSLLEKYNIYIDSKELTTPKGFYKLYKILDKLSDNYLNTRIRRLQNFVEMSIIPGPHFSLGVTSYATWTSPIRKYSDMMNHRFLKSIIQGKKISRPDSKIIKIISENRRRNRIALKDLEDWLYSLFLSQNYEKRYFDAEIIDIFRGGIKAKLIENGANVFIPKPFLHINKNQMTYDQEAGIIYVKGKIYYRLSDIIKIKLIEIRLDKRSIIASPVLTI